MRGREKKEEKLATKYLVLYKTVVFVSNIVSRKGKAQTSKEMLGSDLRANVGQ